MTDGYKIFAGKSREAILLKMLNWADRFNIFCLLHSDAGNYDDGFPELFAVGSTRALKLDAKEKPFDKLNQFIVKKPSWLFGHINYEINTGITPRFPDTQGFPQGFFFEPQYLFKLNADGVEVLIGKEGARKIAAEIEAMEVVEALPPAVSGVQSRISREQYLTALQALKGHLKRGDCYEINYCQEFFARTTADPIGLFFALTRHAPNPFSAFYKVNGKYAVCASPERFLKKEGDVLLSQPIKGTAPRNQDPETDEKLKRDLEQSAKDISENVMVVDLVRNDLSRVCVPGSVTVPELFAVKTFPGVHQMISSVTGTLQPHTGIGEILEATFPMGSMTGAPKQRVMELIDQYEYNCRGLFSGSIGFIDPGGDFDFNVVIRTLFYNSDEEYLSFQAGGGITWYSDPEKEYEESLLKTLAIRSILSGKDR